MNNNDQDYKQLSKIGKEQTNEIKEKIEIKSLFEPLSINDAHSEIFNTFSDGMILLVGKKDYSNEMVQMGISKFITVDEYASIFPKIVPISFRPQNGAKHEEIKRKIKARFSLIEDY